MRYSLGITQIEFRLRVGYHGIAVPCIGARRNQAIHDLAVSEQMVPWSIGGDYDRPIPRRIAEEAGLPRDRFGMRKAATGHSHLNDPSRFSEQSLNDYRRFVRERHAELPRHIYRYWRARARWHHYLLKVFGPRPPVRALDPPAKALLPSSSTPAPSPRAGTTCSRFNGASRRCKVGMRSHLSDVVPCLVLADILIVHRLSYVKLSNAVTLSALVQTPTAPDPLTWSSSISIYRVPSRETRMLLPENSTRNVCH